MVLNNFLNYCLSLVIVQGIAILRLCSSIKTDPKSDKTSEFSNFKDSKFEIACPYTTSENEQKNNKCNYMLNNCYEIVYD